MTYDENIFSDLYKDAHGFRPRGHEFYRASPERKQQIWDQTLAALDDAIAETEARQAQGIVEFECEVATMVRHGAPDRGCAIRWISEASRARDHSELEWAYDLPLGYLSV
jgi:hypothetical protein